MDAGRLDILGGIVQNRVIDPQWLEVEVVMVEVVILEDVVVEVMVVAILRKSWSCCSTTW